MINCAKCEGKREFYYGADVVTCSRCDGTGDETVYLSRLAAREAAQDRVK